MDAKAYTLPELLVTMVIGGILLLCLFDGVDMIRVAVQRNSETDAMSNLSRLEKFELLKERSDSLSVGDSIRFYRQGKMIGSCARWD